MALSFPNKSRAFDATRRAVRFWGHDSAMEVAFFITEDALKRVEPHMRFDEAARFDQQCSEPRRRLPANPTAYSPRQKGSNHPVGPNLAASHPRHPCIPPSTREG